MKLLEKCPLLNNFLVIVAFIIVNILQILGGKKS